ncbi:MAG: hypothetical protein AAGA58_05445 [Verrucomicrobiota bacterium]
MILSFFGVWALTAIGSVTVDFGHSNTSTGAFQNTGVITLNFSVDGSGNVTLDASSSDTDPAAFVNEFDGPVGTISASAAFGSTFTITLTGTGNLRVDALATGLSIQGQNPNRIDRANEAVNGSINLSLLPATTLFDLTTLDYASATTSAGTTARFTFGGSTLSYPISSSAGSLNLTVQDTEIVGGNADGFVLDSAVDADGQGFGFKGFTFDIVSTAPPPPPPGDAVVPVEVLSWDGKATSEIVSVDVPSGASPATHLFAQVHNLKFGGQMSVRVNDGIWQPVFNHTVDVLEPEASQGGIGGINATIRLTHPLPSGLVVPGQSNDVEFRLNGTDRVVSAIRVVDFDFLNASGGRIVAPSGFLEEDPNFWQPPRPGSADILAGESLWTSGAIVDDPVSNTPIRGTCASCHFADGSDLKYFNYSNESIIARSRFHGMSEVQGEQIASYIRTRLTPNPGRPWDPPFQPGPGLDPLPGDSASVVQEKAESWMAGAGLANVVESEAEILPHVFPEGTSPASIARVINHEGTFSVREIPIPIQFPDWNSWLPDFAPEDMWPTSSFYDQPYAIYNVLRAKLANQGPAALAANGDLNEAFRVFKNQLEDWYGEFRLAGPDLANEPPTSLARVPELTREEVVTSLVRWMAVKILESTREYDLESVGDSVAAMQASGHPEYLPELLAIPGGSNRSIVFALGPHITSNNHLHFEGQPERLGKMESNQWYHLQLVMNSGYRMQVNMNVPLDWAYQINHLESAGERSGRFYGFQQLITQIKMYQLRNTGAGISQTGFSQRTLNPWRLFSNLYRDRSLYQGALDAVEPDLWRKTFEEFLYEWLDVVEALDINAIPRSNTDRNQFETADYVPQSWPGGTAKYFQLPAENQADSLFRLLPLLIDEGVDEMLLTDLKTLCKQAWSLGNWDALFSLRSLFHENFESAASSFSGLMVRTIKDANYVNTYPVGPKNGGGRYVGEAALASAGSQVTATRTGDVPLQGATRLRLRLRTAVEAPASGTLGDVSLTARLVFDHVTTEFAVGSPLALDEGLVGTEFESFDEEIDVPPGATKITSVILEWNRTGGAAATTVFADNIHLLPLDETVDTTPPSQPVLTNVTKPFDRRLRANWSATNPTSDGVIGYNVYRRVNGEPIPNTTRLNNGLVDNPYIRFEDYTAERGISYRYHITAVDGAGNESVPSNSIVSILPDVTAPDPPDILWSVNEPGVLRLCWTGVITWDVAGYEIDRRLAGQSVFSTVGTVTSEEVFGWSDPAAVDGESYEYQVRSFDILGNISGPSPVYPVMAATGVTYVDLWSAEFDGMHGWDSTDSLIAGATADFDRDGLATLWEYLQGGNPTVADLDSERLPAVRVVEDGGIRYLEVIYQRSEPLPPGVLVELQGASDLSTWSDSFVVEGGLAAPELTVTYGNPSDGKRLVTARIEASEFGSGSNVFARLGVSEH